MQGKKSDSLDTALPDPRLTEHSTSNSVNDATAVTDNPLSPIKDDATQIVDSIREDSTTQASQADNNNTNELAVDSAPVASSTSAVEASSVAVEPLSDAEFILSLIHISEPTRPY